MVITKQDIRGIVSEVLNEKLRMESFERYEPHDFQSPASEESFYSISIAKSECHELIKFWIKGFEKIIKFEKRYDGESDYLEWYETDIVEVEKSNFYDKFQQMTSRLNKSTKLIEYPINYYQIRDEWNEQIFIIESDAELMLVYWYTTA